MGSGGQCAWWTIPKVVPAKLLKGLGGIFEAYGNAVNFNAGRYGTVENRPFLGRVLGWEEAFGERIDGFQPVVRTGWMVA
jgi:hypothetical protein